MKFYDRYIIGNIIINLLIQIIILMQLYVYRDISIELFLRDLSRYVKYKYECVSLRLNKGECYSNVNMEVIFIEESIDIKKILKDYIEKIIERINEF